MVVVGRTSRSVRVAGYLSNVTIEKLDMRYRQRTAALIRLGEMAAGMAHELTQPLSAITFVAEGMMERIRRGNVDAAWVGTTADRIAGSAKRAIKLVDHIRAFGRNERQPLSPASWSEALAGALEILAPRLRRYVIDDQVAPDLPLIMGVPILMEQVLINLIGNAIDAYEGHDPESDADRRCVTVQAGVDGDVVSLRVSDRAGGIDPSVAGRLFEPFVTTKDPGKGTGLGLALCSETVMDMGGTLYVRNENGGAVFEVRVPRAVPEGFSARGC
jgi:two-component system C4-dicarboxylate transport sensor histidine kinase DctB